MKRKYIDRPNWQRIVQKQFSLQLIEEDEFSGYLSILQLHQVKEPLIKEIGDKFLRLVDNGYIWLQHLPLKENYAITTMYDQDQQIIQWYFDISRENGVDETGIPFFDDLYLDVVVLPSGEVVLLDEDELEVALECGDITQADYDLAYNAANDLMNGIARDPHRLAQLCERHLRLMLGDQGVSKRSEDNQDNQVNQD